MADFQNNIPPLKNSNNSLKIAIFILTASVMAVSVVNVLFLSKYIPFNSAKFLGASAYFVGDESFNGSMPVSANNIYPLFLCPCCGEPLDKNKICCPMAKERINYIDSLVTKGLSEKEIILVYVKKYGLNSLVDENKQKEIKEYLIKTAPADRPIISIDKESYDLGDVSQKNGETFVYFQIKNDGKKDLVINKLDTSCGCTSASIVFKGSEGPRFAMPGHGIKSVDNWQIAVPAGETAQLKVYYNPDIHKDFRGYAIREISIYSNDPINFEKKVKIELTQVD